MTKKKAAQTTSGTATMPTTTNQPATTTTTTTPVAPTGSLTVQEREQLTALENTIEIGLRNAAEALLEVHERRLFRDHGTWENYVRERWHRSRDWAYKQVRYMAVTRKINSVDESIQISETESREIEKIEDPEIMVRAILLAERKARQSGKERTAALVKEAVEEVTEKQKEKGRKGAKAEKLRKEIAQLENELAIVEPLPSLQVVPVQHEEQQEAEEQSFEAATEQMEANARAFIQAKVAELDIALGLDTVIQLLESLGVQWKGLGESHG